MDRRIMRRLFLPLVCFILLAFVSSTGARMNLMIVTPQTPAAGGCSGYSSCEAGKKLFDWDGSTTSMGSNVCSVGDDTAATTGEMSIAAGWISIDDTSDNGNDYYNFAISSGDIWPADTFTIVIKFNATVITDGGKLFSIYNGANDLVDVEWETSSGNDIRIRHKGNGTSTVQTFDTNLSTSTDYTMTMAAENGPGFRMAIPEATFDATYADKDITTMTDVDSSNGFRVGNTPAINVEATIDYLRVYGEFCTDLF
jgi:hypothetical protein